MSIGADLTTQTEKYRYTIDLKLGKLTVTGKAKDDHTYKPFRYAVMLSAEEEHVYVVTTRDGATRSYKFVIVDKKLYYVDS